MDNNEIKCEDYTQYYEIKDEIGRGQYGEIFKGINKKSGEIRAIKIIRINNDMKYLNNELNNMKICSNENDNSVKYYESFYYQGKLIIVMELCDNSLKRILDDRNDGFTSEQIYNIMGQLNNTFKIMYRNNIIHRVIKLDNILIKYKENNNNDSNINFIVKLTDYGISKSLESTNTTSMGTNETMAPEILEGENHYDNKCDLWSIGIIIYQLFFKEYPYRGTQVAIYNQIKKLGNKVLKKTNNEKLDNLIDSLLIREPSKRINYEDYFNHPFFYKENYIESEIEIEEENKEIRIINSYEQCHKKNIWNKFNKEYCNEKEIKKNIVIAINNEIIPFSYFYKFKTKGKYKIKYSFKNNLKNTSYMFSDCESLTNINLSNFNTKEVISMRGMFYNCKSLKNIDFSNLNTQNVTDISYMFSFCKSLTNINLSNLEIQHVINMRHMFSYCTSLTEVDLSNFNTGNAINMSYMFYYCKSLTDINLSNFNTKNVINMSFMFFNCLSLTKVDLSNFNTQNVSYMDGMFLNCQSLKESKIITKDRNIIDIFNNY